MFGIGCGRDDPGHLGQRSAIHVAGKVIQRVRGQAAVAQGGVRRAVGVFAAVLPKTGQRVVVEIVRHVLVHAPIHAGRLQAFGVGGPGIAFIRRAQAVVGVDEGGAAGLSQRIVGAGPQEQPVGIGAGMQ
ncbi:hypothetical protein D3C71_1763480 [compost metagenome]